MSSGNSNLSRVLLIPSAGMGHLVPFVRLATALSARRISVSLLAARSTVSAAESRLLSSLPPDFVLDFPFSPVNSSLFPPSSDPFFLQIEALRRSAHLLPALISTYSPVSSLIVDIFLASSFLPIAMSANIPCFVLFTSSASMLALCSVSPFLSRPIGDVNIANVFKIPITSLPPPLRDPIHIFTTFLVENGRALTSAKGILVNTFFALEPDVLAALNSGEVVAGLPPVIALGPLPLAKNQPTIPSPAVRWLDEQPERSVMYVSFGSRTAMSVSQMRELGAGLEMSGCRFLWVVKSSKVDREEAAEIEELMGEGYMKRVEERGLVLREWVEQEVVLGHRAVAGFLSHCGWNSVTEAAAAGVRILAWPRMGDQRINAALVPERGLGIWPEKWAWEADEGVVAAEDIATKVREVMGDYRLAETAAKVRAEATAAVAEGGSSEDSFRCLATKL